MSECFSKASSSFICGYILLNLECVNDSWWTAGIEDADVKGGYTAGSDH